MKSSSKNFHIVGGGFSGLAVAWYLNKLGASVTIYEKSHRLGGLLGSHFTPHGLVETAANGLLASRDVEDLVAELGITLLPAQRRSTARYIFRQRPTRYPLKGLEWLKVVKFLLARRSGLDNLMPSAGESLKDWSDRHWGESLTQNLVEPAFQGVFGARARDLSARLVLHGLFNPLPKGRLRGTVAPRAGMGELINFWTVELLKRGVNIELNSGVTKFPEDDPVILCVSPEASASFLLGHSPSYLSELRALPRVGLVSVTAHFAPHPTDLRGFGVLLPRSEKFNSLGVLFNSDIFHERGEALRSETYIFELLGSNPVEKEAFKSRLLADRMRLQSSRSSLEELSIHSWPQSLPLYGVALEKFLAHHSLAIGNIRLFGNSYGVLGLSRILTQAKILGSELMKETS